MRKESHHKRDFEYPQEYYELQGENQFDSDNNSKYQLNKRYKQSKDQEYDYYPDNYDENLSIPETITEMNEHSESNMTSKINTKTNSKLSRFSAKYVIPQIVASSEAIKINRICIIKENYFLNDSQEPWPNDVKLFQPYEVEQILLTDNANCLAVQAFLKMCNLNFEVVSKANAEYMSPSGKVPFIKCGQFIIAELEGIVQFVNNKGISLTANLEPEQRTDVRAYMSLIHNVLENAELYICWIDKETYNEVTKPRNGSVYPWPLNYLQTWSKRSNVIKRLKLMNWYNKTLNDVFQEVETCCQALSDRLEGKEYFFGKRLTEVDALVYGHISSILSMSIPTHNDKLLSIVKKYDVLIDHCKRIHKFVTNSNNNSLDSTFSIASTCSNSKFMQSRILSQSQLEMNKEDSLKESSSSAENDDSASLTLSDVNTEDLLLNDEKLENLTYRE